MALIPSRNTDKEQKKAAEDDVLLREIDDAVRQDQYANFAKQYGRPLLGVAVAGVLAFGGYLFWDSRQEAALEEQSDAYVGALDQVQAGNMADASAKLDPVIGEASAGTRAAAQLMKAGIAAQDNKPGEAAALFAAVAADEDAPPALRDLARIREVATQYDELGPDEVVSRLKPLAEPGNAWFGSAGELVAHAYLDQGKREEAGVLFGELARNEDVPRSIRDRARDMAGQLGVDSIGDADEFLEELQNNNAPPPPAQ